MALLAEPLRVTVILPATLVSTAPLMPPGRLPRDSESPALALVSTMVADSILLSSTSVTRVSRSAMATAGPPSVKLVW
ncbi:hypothetical protein D9M68_1005930 [compost metagenome]